MLQINDLNIMNILVVSLQICYIEVLDITKPRINEQIWPVPGDFIKSRFHCIHYAVPENIHTPHRRDQKFQVVQKYFQWVWEKFGISRGEEGISGGPILEIPEGRRVI